VISEALGWTGGNFLWLSAALLLDSVTEAYVKIGGLYIFGAPGAGPGNAGSGAGTVNPLPNRLFGSATRDYGSR